MSNTRYDAESANEFHATELPRPTRFQRGKRKNKLIVAESQAPVFERVRSSPAITCRRIYNKAIGLEIEQELNRSVRSFYEEDLQLMNFLIFEGANDLNFGQTNQNIG